MEGKGKHLSIILIILIAGMGISYYGYWQKINAENVTKIANTPQVAAVDTGSKSDVVIYVSGAVVRPGVLTVPAGTRVIDAINQAGGLSAGADVKKINMAQIVKDGMQVQVPVGSSAVVSSSGKNSSTGEMKNSKGKININYAERSELDKLPGIGPATADRIIEYRQTNGLFQSIDDLKKVKGIGDSKLNKFRDKICI